MLVDIIVELDLELTNVDVEEDAKV